MTAVCRVPPVPMGQQGPPARSAPCKSKPLRVARGPLLSTTGTAYRRDQEKGFRQDVGCWQEGYRAGCLGVLTCPHMAGTNESWSWHSGFIEGKAARFAENEACS